MEVIYRPVISCWQWANMAAKGIFQVMIAMTIQQTEATLLLLGY